MVSNLFNVPPGNQLTWGLTVANDQDVALWVRNQAFAGISPHIASRPVGSFRQADILDEFLHFCVGEGFRAPCSGCPDVALETARAMDGCCRTAALKRSARRDEGPWRNGALHYVRQAVGSVALSALGRGEPLVAGANDRKGRSRQPHARLRLATCYLARPTLLYAGQPLLP